MREPHKKKLYKVNIMKPIIASELGSENDPCFGKHYSIKADECLRCGDADVCSIICQNQIHREIEKQASKGKFLDIEEAELVEAQNKKLETLIRKRAQKAEGKWVSFDKLITIVKEKFNLTDIDDPQIINRLIKAAQKVKEVTINKSLTKFKWEQ